MAAALQIGLVFETPGTYPKGPGDPDDYAAEYEPLETIRALQSAVAAIGHACVELGAPHDLLRALGEGALPPVDAVLSIAEGRGTRNREGWVPSLLELAGIPLLGSDALTLSTSLDKAWTLERVAAAGGRVLPYAVLDASDEVESAVLPAAFPLFVKPRWEGTAKGIHAASLCHDRRALSRAVEEVTERYQQPALVEAFAPGPEYTVTVVGNGPPRVLPTLQRALEADTGIGIHALERPGAPAPPPGGYHHVTPGTLEPALEQELEAASIRAYEALECQDFARLDFKLDREGRACFLEINPLPTFAPDGSFGILAELAGQPYAAFVGEILALGLERLGLAPGAQEGAAR